MGIDTFFVERHSLVRAVHRSSAECDTISFRFSFIWRGFAMDSQIHWDKVYAEKAPTAMSWYRQHLETSLSLLERVASKEAAIIEVGGGESSLVDDLLSHGHEKVTVLDISQTAINETKQRLGDDSKRVRWLVANITNVELPRSAYDVWHDRAVFHFLTQPS